MGSAAGCALVPPSNLELALLDPQRLRAQGQRHLLLVRLPLHLGNQRLKRALTKRSELIENVHRFDPLQAPDHPASFAPCAGNARRVI